MPPTSSGVATEPIKRRRMRIASSISAATGAGVAEYARVGGRTVRVSGTWSLMNFSHFSIAPVKRAAASSGGTAARVHVQGVRRVFSPPAG